jgi:putative hydrolase of HD superfamily
MEKSRFEKQIEFILELDKEKSVYRQTHISGYKRQENDAEHAWHMAVMAYLLKEYSNQEIDLLKTLMMILIHDVVEIDAGDTYAYDPEKKKDQSEREKLASDRLFGLLPPDQKQQLQALFIEFEENQTPEAKFAHAMDNFQPLLLNDSNNGKDWVRHGIKKSQVVARQEKSKRGSNEIWEYSKALIERNAKKGNLKDE